MQSDMAAAAGLADSHYAMPPWLVSHASDALRRAHDSDTYLAGGRGDGKATRTDSDG